LAQYAQTFILGLLQLALLIMLQSHID
jgi:hypothetical protein